MTKTLIIPDVHGRDYWKKHVQESVDFIVFLGDIFDSFTIDRKTQLKNAYEIIDFKTQNPDKVVLCYGNHDLHYLANPPFRGTGWSSDFSIQANIFMESNKHHFKMLHQVDNVLFSHAGITDTWWFSHSLTIQSLIKKFDIDPNNIEEIIDIISKTQYNPILFDIGKSRGGSDVSGGIFWADKKDHYITKKLFANYSQFVGHTSHKNHVETLRDEENNASVTFTDCWDWRNNKIIVDI